jgi:uncharacterized protein with PQ loop repeat
MLGIYILTTTLLLIVVAALWLEEGASGVYVEDYIMLVVATFFWPFFAILFGVVLINDSLVATLRTLKGWFYDR